jgi:hypothetical protein
VALQCSEADGHLILSKENSAARLLSRPGEAIYNNANGLLEGNNLFQTVWLSESKREECLVEVARRAARCSTAGQPSLTRPLIVFEGNAPAHLDANPLVQRLVEGATARGQRSKEKTEKEGAAPTTYSAWLGDAIAIKDPTAAVFRRQSGANLLLMGQHPEAALSVLSASIVSLALGLRQHAQRSGDAGMASLFLFPSSATGDDRSEEMFRQLASVFQGQAEVVGWKELPGAIATLGAEVERRMAERAAGEPPLFLVIHGLQHFRDLRRQEEDFGYSRRDEKKPVPPSRHFNTILREGPPVGVFTLTWCDTLNNLQRTFDRAALREFEMRVLFQMNANDSSNLIDSPVASKLGLYRALFYSEEQGRTEKFRPYGLPPLDWLVRVKQQLARSSAPPLREQAPA